MHGCSLVCLCECFLVIDLRESFMKYCHCNSKESRLVPSVLRGFLY
uniref:Uncharacterized protein n=1 Tax=Melopsittacus undulatus TaxID=13146 RepID=A0A8V5HDX0_MELUD